MSIFLHISSLAFEKIWVTPGTYYVEILRGSVYSSPLGIEYGIKVNFFTTPNSLVEENGIWYYVEEGEKVNATTLVYYYGTWYSALT